MRKRKPAGKKALDKPNVTNLWDVRRSGNPGPYCNPLVEAFVHQQAMGLISFAKTENGGFSAVAWQLLVQLARSVDAFKKDEIGVKHLLEECLAKAASMLDEAGQKSVAMLCNKERFAMLAEEEEKMLEEVDVGQQPQEEEDKRERVAKPGVVGGGALAAQGT